VAGVWSQTRKGHRLRVRVKGFRPLSKAIRSEVRDEAEDLGRFLGGPDVELTFG